MGTVYMTCGLAFAGKTTLARALAGRLGCAVVSLDEINRERGFPDGGVGLPAKVWAETHGIAVARVEGLLREGGDAVVDDTCCFRFLRDDYREAAARHGARALVVRVDTPRDEIEARRRRNRASGERNQVFDEVFDGLVRTFEWPQKDEEVAVWDGREAIDGWLDRLLNRTAARR